MRISAGVALLRRRNGQPEVLLVHPGGPFWRNKDEHAWSIPKGEIDDVDGDLDDDDPMVEATARREFAEETGQALGDTTVTRLPRFRVGSGKHLIAFVAAGDLDADQIVSNSFEMEWPPRSGRQASFPEVDRAAWYRLDEARGKLHKGQAALVDQLDEILAGEVFHLP